MAKANNFASTKQTVVLLVLPDTEPKVLKDNDDNVMVFGNLKKAQKHVANNIEGEFYPFIEYANDEPVQGAGDRQETNTRRCLRCNGFLRPSYRQTKSVMPDGSEMAVTELDCPKCDLGE
jgi:uncharacterized protein with PIN domain